VTPIQSSISKTIYDRCHKRDEISIHSFAFASLSLQKTGHTFTHTLSDMVDVSYFGQREICYSTTLIVIDQTILLQAFHICLFSADHIRIADRIISIVY